ncbi:hypothetical protein J6590_031569, partial [Homalodisca vitripennis]
MCGNFGIEFIEANSYVRLQEGIHIKKRATSRLGALSVDAISVAVQALDKTHTLPELSKS